MSRFRELPGGIDRASYTWPHISAVHPEAGVYEMDVHCVRDPQKNSMVLIAFLAHTRPGSRERSRQIDIVSDAARGLSNVVEPLAESDISADIATRLAETFYAKPGTKMVVMQVARP